VVGPQPTQAERILVSGRHNLLLLDEPTNNLDPGSRPAVARACAGGRAASCW